MQAVAVHIQSHKLASTQSTTGPQWNTKRNVRRVLGLGFLGGNVVLIRSSTLSSRETHQTMTTHGLVGLQFGDACQSASTICICGQKHL